LRISLPSAAPVPALSRSSEAAPAAPTLSRSSEAAPAAPRETGVVLAYPPAAPAPSPNLTLAKARGIDPLRAPASPGAEPFSGPAPRPLAPVAAKASSPTPAASAPPPPALTASSALSAPSLGATGFPGFQAGPKLDPPGPGKTESRKPAAGSSSSGGGSAGSPKKPGYDEALSLYHKGEYARAGESFDSFLRSAPGSALTPNALYWQGECLYSLGRYDDAIMLFKDVAARYPRHDKAAASLLKAGYSYERLKDLENARFYWQILIDDFPASSPAALARKRMAG
jgi:tol-pal system protein YbgF